MLQSAQNFQQKNEVNDWKSWIPKRGEVYLVDLGQDSNMDSEQRGVRPFVLLSNNIGNAASTILVGCSITSKRKPLSKIHVHVGVEEGLKFDSYIMVEHIRSISKRRCFVHDVYPTKICTLSEKKMLEVERAIMFELGFIIKTN